MRFSLRRQLLIIGLLVLTLPWLSASFVRETELALREAQSGFLANLAAGLAASITPESLQSLPTDAPAVFAHSIKRSPLLDGFVDDWLLGVGPEPAQVNGQDMRLLIGESDNALWLYVESDGPQVSVPVYDIACIDASDKWHLLAFSPEAPGLLDIKNEDGQLRVRANWQSSGTQSRLEARLPKTVCNTRIGVAVTVNGKESRSYRESTPPRLVSRDAALQAVLSDIRVPGVDRYVMSVHGWRVTDIVGDRKPTATVSRDTAVAAIYRRLLSETQPSTLVDDQQPQATLPKLATMLRGETVQLRAENQAGGIMSIAAQPLLVDDTVKGVLVVRQDSAAILTLNNPSLLKLTYRTVLLTATVVALLLIWASWVSWRVRRLSKAANTALDKRGRLKTELPGKNAQDEIGRLSRDFGTLLQELGTQQQWLQTLADKLSHELRTPMAVVQSSLDNLMSSDLDLSQRTLGKRALQGVSRLHTILNAMSQANRAEQAARDADFEIVNLSDLMTQLVAAYEQTFPLQQWHSQIDNKVSVDGSADLIVQMLDKIADNAAGFTPDDKRITVILDTDDSHALIRLVNEDSTLPDGNTDALFQTFVSNRDRSGDDLHLGFGLYIAKLIAEGHGGTIAAANWQDGDIAGVCITIAIPLKQA